MWLRVGVKEVIDTLNVHGWSPLFYAGERKKAGIVETLLKNGAGT